MLTRTRFLDAALILVLVAALGCGADDGNPSSGALVVKGVAHPQDAIAGMLTVSTVIDPEMGLRAFADKAAAFFGTAAGGFRPTQVKLGVSLPDSMGVSSLQEAFSGNVEILLKPATGTDAPILIGTIASPKGAAGITARVAASRGDLDPIRSDILGASLATVVRGPTPWFRGGTQRLGLVITVALEAVR